ncbi:N-acetylglucosamine repressor [Cronobacter turicensis]|jgi:N-acetylglucosamine repressor|uniref:ROK family transcriptional regulator n=3 Tax=Cronobacter turicensis TaxID=413502 RepID=A0A2T7B2C5_9ENTR|nr:MULTISPECIES: N-acetylglucosamine repressor [Cronobacter]MEB8539734.1 ROK family transcriptional regulator [Cronobacter sakazakii]CBA29187.1 N-acetylglucosamine repressor [Cronobacter turicensis z3032]CCJ91581.1 N-acetylglucosamine-6P-responsive transcriptional repressor NagC, ROK family [Cronobacter turicensis 564]EGT4491410.1 ROK family transcriptional regulator [Cronobacter turicensis]EGT5683004.1 ROK family transcriptional regulator [Cronobacter turicensis]
MTTGGQAQIGNVDLVKQLNSAAVYRLIDQQGPISRIQIAEQSQLAPASVTKITRQLIERGLIKEVDQQASTGGRRAISIVTETRHFQAVGVRLGRHDATLTLFDLSSKVLAEEHFPLPERTQETLEHALLNIIAQFIDAWQRKIRELIAVSVILPGLVDPESGVIRYMPHINVENWPLVDALQKRFNVACFVGHDIRSLALAEHYFGATRDCEDSILVRVHRGTGAGIISNGRIFIGRNGNVGEIGHIQVDPLGERCHCGNFGCLETVAANAAIEQRVRQLLEQGHPSRLTQDECNIKAICKAANRGDALACEVVERVGRQLGKTIAIAINLFNPQKVVIAGEIVEAQKVLLPAIESCINTQSLKAFRKNLPVVPSQLDHRSAIGAFALVKRAMLNGLLLQRLLES